MSAIIGQDWRPKSYRELLTQWQAHQLDRWAHTAAIVRSNSGKKHVPYHKLNPYASPRSSADVSIPIMEKNKSTFANKISKSQVAYYEEQIRAGK